MTDAVRRPPPSAVLDYYARYPEESRLDSGGSRLEFERSKEFLLRVLPTPPGRILDVGGGAGAYSASLPLSRPGTSLRLRSTRVNDSPESW